VARQVLTVLAGDPNSAEPASSWDAQSGFATAGASWGEPLMLARVALVDALRRGEWVAWLE
jgi:hypothetical protein